MSEPQAVPVRDWVAEVRHGIGTEAASYLRTLGGVLFAPRTFVNRWRSHADAMNPLGFLAVSVLILGAVRAYGWEFIYARGSMEARAFAGEAPIWAQLWGAAGPALHYAVLGLIVHYTLRALGTRRAPASDSAALTFYCAGAAAFVMELVVWGTTLTLLELGVVPLNLVYNVLFAGFGVALSTFCGYLGYTLGTLHAPRWWHMPIAFMLAFVLTGLFFGHVNPPGDYGMRWYLQLTGPYAFIPQLRL